MEAKALDSFAGSNCDRRVNDVFEAAGPLSGFLWQLRQALLILFTLDQDQSVTTEREDDICTISAGGLLLSAIQAKHSVKPGTVRATTPLWWKTIRVWCDRLPKLSASTRFSLATTSTAKGTLSPFVMGETPTDANRKSLMSKMDQVANKQPNKHLTDAYTAWNGLTESAKTQLLSRFSISHELTNLADSTADLDAALLARYIPKHVLHAARRQIVGWFQLQIEQQMAGRAPAVDSSALHAQLTDIHHSVQAGAPFLEPETSADELEQQAGRIQEEGSMFLSQMDLLRARSSALERATMLYIRARNARGEWLDSGVLGAWQLQRHETDLEDNWKNRREETLRELEPGVATETDLLRAGWTLHDMCMNYRARLGAGLADSFFVGGSYHIMADGLRVGWHPEFQDRLENER